MNWWYPLYVSNNIYYSQINFIIPHIQNSIIKNIIFFKKWLEYLSNTWFCLLFILELASYSYNFTPSQWDTCQTKMSNLKDNIILWESRSFVLLLFCFGFVVIYSCFICILPVLGNEPRASYMSDKCSTTEQYFRLLLLI